MVEPATGRPSPESIANIRLAAKLALKEGWDTTQIGCLDNLWSKESMFRTRNSYGSAYGIPQALPGEKMASEGADWQTNPVTQERWGIKYIKSRWDTACGAWQHSIVYGWY
jgi:resuscitation-promoting factor RpfB